MSRKLFTEEQISILRQNLYVYSVSPSALALTKEFKEIFYAQYQEGKSPRTILEDHVYIVKQKFAPPLSGNFDSHFRYF